jgi:hypothetical protein
MADLYEDFCIWDEDKKTESWDTQCGKKFNFLCDGPKENGFIGCPFCLKKILVADKIKLNVNEVEERQDDIS